MTTALARTANRVSVKSLIVWRLFQVKMCAEMDLLDFKRLPDFVFYMPQESTVEDVIDSSSHQVIAPLLTIGSS